MQIWSFALRRRDTVRVDQSYLNDRFSRGRERQLREKKETYTPPKNVPSTGQTLQPVYAPGGVPADRGWAVRRVAEGKSIGPHEQSGNGGRRIPPLGRDRLHLADLPYEVGRNAKRQSKRNDLDGAHDCRAPRPQSSGGRRVL